MGGRGPVDTRSMSVLTGSARNGSTRIRCTSRYSFITHDQKSVTQNPISQCVVSYGLRITSASLTRDPSDLLNEVPRSPVSTVSSKLDSFRKTET